MNLALVDQTLTLPKRPFTTSELSKLALDGHQLRLAVDRGDVKHPFRGVFVPPGVDDSTELRAEALARVTSSHHVICDRTAAWLHGIDTFSLQEAAQIPPVETCALSGHRPTRVAGADARTRDLLPRDIMVINGAQVTTPLRTALDLGCNLRRREAMAALNEFARHHGVDRAELDRELSRFKGRRGVRQLRDLIPLVSGKVESQRESWVHIAIADAGLPQPEAQVWIDVDGVPTYRLDFAYRLARIAIEYDGEEFHERTEQQKADDDERRAWLRAHGWTIIVIKLGDFKGDRSDRWIREIKDALKPTYSTRRF
ncbi:MAG: DUF559 domain-containing protein [Nocardioides sp.]|nr:DUF559 domain-containing protein [Nocardioides sp.]